MIEIFISTKQYFNLVVAFFTHFGNIFCVTKTIFMFDGNICVATEIVRIDDMNIHGYKFL